MAEPKVLLRGFPYVDHVGIDPCVEWALYRTRAQLGDSLPTPKASCEESSQRWCKPRWACGAHTLCLPKQHELRDELSRRAVWTSTLLSSRIASLGSPAVLAYIHLCEDSGEQYHDHRSEPVTTHELTLSNLPPPSTSDGHFLTVMNSRYTKKTCRTVACIESSAKTRRPPRY